VKAIAIVNQKGKVGETTPDINIRLDKRPLPNWLWRRGIHPGKGIRNDGEKRSNWLLKMDIFTV
jgi:hypothetical protein